VPQVAAYAEGRSFQYTFELFHDKALLFSSFNANGNNKIYKMINKKAKKMNFLPGLPLLCTDEKINLFFVSTKQQLIN
jgi:hypothetical protein